MNKSLGRVGAGVTGLGVLAFAISMVFGLFMDALFASCFASIFIALGFMLFMAAMNTQQERSACGVTAMGFSAIYVTIILLVYFAQCTTVRMNPTLSAETLSIISYGHLGSLFFNYDLLGYGMMALATFFTGLNLRAETQPDRMLKMLLTGHGIFFPGCLLVPMFPVFASGSSNVPGTILLEIWCLYFLPICILGYRHFSK